MIVWVSIFAFPLLLVAKDKLSRYPRGCLPINYSMDYHALQLQPVKRSPPQAIYFIRNTSSKPVTLWQTRSGDAPYIVHINNVIGAKSWSVFALSEKLAKFICVNRHKNLQKSVVLDCRDVLDVCQFPYARFGGNHRVK